MDFEAAARSLINAVGGILSDENIEGVIGVFTTMIEVNNLNWEGWITQETNEALAKDNISCDCGRQIKIERQPACVLYDIC